MRHTLVASFVAVFAFGGAPALAQESGGGTGNGGSGGGSVANRPALWTQNARTRHQEIQQARLFGGGYIPEGSSLGASASSSSSGGLSGILNSLGGSGLSGLLSSVLNGGLLNSLGSGGSTGTTPTGTNTGNTTGGGEASPTPAGTSAGGSNPNIPPNVTPEVIAMLEAAGININEVFPPDSSSAAPAGERAKSKFASTAQSTNPPPVFEQEDSFKTRLINALLETTFSALVLAFSNQAFIERIADAIRPNLGPILNPGAFEDEQETSTEPEGEGSTSTGSGGTTTTGEGSIVLAPAGLLAC